MNSDQVLSLMLSHWFDGDGQKEQTPEEMLKLVERRFGNG